MKIIGDVNQRTGSHAASHYNMHRRIAMLTGNEVEFHPLGFGDYILETPEIASTIKRRGDKLKKMDTAPDIHCSVDFKANLSEVAMNITGGKANHDRFIDELILAQKHNCKFYILIQEEFIRSIDDIFQWKNPRMKQYYFQKAKAEKAGEKPKFSKPPVAGPQLAKAMWTIEKNYGCKFVFTKGIDAAQAIIDLLTTERDE